MKMAPRPYFPCLHYAWGLQKTPCLPGYPQKQSLDAGMQGAYLGGNHKKQEKGSGQREERRKDKLIKDELARSPLRRG